MISILMPVKNAMPYLKDCLESIIGQSEEYWELLAVNDHSDDNSLQVLESYAESDQRIKVFQNPGKGIISALRKAYSESEGKWITRMDADDLMAPRKLKLLKEKLTDHGEGYVATAFVKYFSETALGNGYLKYEQWLNKLTETAANFEEIYKECVIPSPCWMIHRKDLETCGAFESDVYPEDYDLCFRFYKNQLKVAPVFELLHYWRDHQSRTSRNDPKYADVHFFDLKLHYFEMLDLDLKRPLFLWGAGRKGKAIAKLLTDRKIYFQWITDNPKKIGHNIYGIVLEDDQYIKEGAQVIIVVAQPDAVDLIKKRLQLIEYQRKIDCYSFC